MHFGIFLSLNQKVFAEITVRNNLDFGYTAGAVNSADAYEKNAFQQKCYVNFLWLYHFLFLPEHNACKRKQIRETSDNDNCPTFCGCVYDGSSPNLKLSGY